MILFTGIPSAYPCFSSVNGRGGNIHDGTTRNVISLSIRMKTFGSAAGASDGYGVDINQHTEA